MEFLKIIIEKTRRERLMNEEMRTTAKTDTLQEDLCGWDT
jgi:hypothetical protein